jgi:glutamyl-tRNA reductase
MKEEMHKIMKERKQKPVFIIDISVPRNIDPLINELDNVYLYDVDNLQGIIETNKEERVKEAESAEKIVEEEIGSFSKWTSSLSATPTIIALRNMAEALRQDELETTLKKLGPLEEKQIKAIEYLSISIVNKLIHPPTAALKEEHDDKDLMVDMIKKLYGLETEENNGEKK